MGSKGNEFHLQPLRSLAEQYPMGPDSQGREEDPFQKVDYLQRGQRYKSHMKDFEETLQVYTIWIDPRGECITNVLKC